jgi:hypothetical protein
MAHPLATELAPLINLEVTALHEVVARWIVAEHDLDERARYRAFGSELSGLKRRIEARTTPPSREEIEIALTALLVLAGRRAGVAPKSARVQP